MAILLGKPKKHKSPSDQWYYFMFFLKEGGEIKLSLYSHNGTPLISVKAKDSKYKKFDRIVIHGGYPYYIDDLKIISI